MMRVADRSLSVTRDVKGSNHVVSSIGRVAFHIIGTGIVDMKLCFISSEGVQKVSDSDE